MHRNQKKVGSNGRHNRRNRQIYPGRIREVFPLHFLPPHTPGMPPARSSIRQRLANCAAIRLVCRVQPGTEHGLQKGGSLVQFRREDTYGDSENEHP